MIVKMTVFLKEKVKSKGFDIFMDGLLWFSSKLSI